MPLPASFQVERECFRSEPDTPLGRLRLTVIRRILYTEGNTTYIAGFTTTHMRDSRRDLKFSGSLTNVDWGFDLATQEFYFNPDTADFPVLPIELDTTDWHGLRFRSLLEPGRFRLQEAMVIVENRGGSVVGPREDADVVLLADKIDFFRMRHREAERLIRRGAKVLWERDFPPYLESTKAVSD